MPSPDSPDHAPTNQDSALSFNTTAPVATAARLSRRTTSSYALGSLATGGYATLPGLVLVYYLTDSLGVSAALAGAVVTIAKVWDVLVNPLVGGISDRALASTGSRRGPMMLGAVGLPVSFALMFAAPGSFTASAAAVWVLVAFIAAATFFSLFQVPYVTLPAELTADYRQRTRLIAWRVVVLTFAILLFGAGGPELRGLFPHDPLLGYLVMGVGAGLMLAVGLFPALRIVPRQQPADSVPVMGTFTWQHYRDGWVVWRSSQPFRMLLATFMLQGLATGLMLASAQFVARYVVHDEGAITILFLAMIAPALLMAQVWRRYADRVGKEKAFQWATFLFAVAAGSLVVMIWVPGWWVVGPVAVVGAAYAGLQTLPMAMLPDVIAIDAQYRDGNSRAGAFGGMWTAGETTGMALGATVLTVVLAATGYVESRAGVLVQQPETAVQGIAVSFSVIPALLALVSVWFLRKYPLREADMRLEK